MNYCRYINKNLYKRIKGEPIGSLFLTFSFCFFLLVQFCFEFFNEFRNDLFVVTHDPEGSCLEDRRVGVFVDRDDTIGCSHAGEMLDCSGDTTGDVNLRFYRLTGLFLPDVRRESSLSQQPRDAPRPPPARRQSLSGP